MEEDLRKPSHISYKEYQKKVTKKPNEGIIIFVSAFFILLLLFLGIAKQLSPEIDVSIGDDENSSAATEDVAGNSTSVDDRLKLLQQEDAGQKEQENSFAPELDEKVVLPEHKKSDLTEGGVQEEVTLPNKNVESKSTVTSSSPAKQTTATQAQTNSAKVVVGYYSTRDQAEVAKGIIAESGLNISPYVRNIGGAYTIQVGSYSTREKAQSVVNELLRNNYPARIIIE